MIEKEQKNLAIKLDVSCKDIITNDEIEDGFAYWEVINEKIDTAYLICFYNKGNTFNYERYKDIREKIEKDNDKTEFYNVVFVFEDLDDETKQFDNEYDLAPKASIKREIKELFDQKIAVYTRNDVVQFMLEEEGINYLEYKENSSELLGWIYTIPYLELKKLFNVQGKRAFRRNSRTSLLKTNSTKKKVEKNFREYIINGFFEELKNDSFYIGDEKKKIKELLDADGFNETGKNKPERFWFNHNGVTIFIEKKEKKITRENANIEFDSNCAHIINGAQTMTNMYYQIHDVKKRIKYLIAKKGMDFSKIDIMFEEICNRIKIKTIILEGVDDKVTEITEGLNTQIPISDVDLMASDDLTEKINNMIMAEHIRIIRDGEYLDKYNISVLEFAKKYQIIRLKPGTSKNLNKDIVKMIMNEAKDEPDLGKKLRQVIEADDWWKNNRDKMDDKDDIDLIKRYGRNYYCSYVINRWSMECDKEKQKRYFYDEELMDIYNEFIDSIKSLGKEYGINDFKKDDLFKQIMGISTDTGNVDMYLSDEEKKDIIEFLNEKKNKMGLLSRVGGYYSLLYNKGIKDYRRVIRVKGESGYIVNNGFRLPSSSFLEFSDISEENFESFSFSDSILKKEIEKKYVVLVTDEDDKQVQNVHLLNISFENYEDKAEDIFKKTKQAFEAGDESLLPSFDAGDAFYVRPLFTTANDTFEFSNGKEIAKRTFYVGKEVVGELIEKGLNNVRH